jgi:spore coat protein JB
MNQDSLKCRFMAIRFSIWDLHLYLDTHPGDSQAMQLLAQYEAQYAEIKAQYEEQYGPFEPGNGEAWLKSLWPWELGKGDC